MTSSRWRPSDDAAVDLLTRMLEIPSPSGAEAPLAEFFLGTMRSWGYQVHVDGAGNVVGQLGRAQEPTIALVGHLDTVPGQLPVGLVGDRLYGRGSVDAKGPLAAMVCAAARASDLPGRIVVVGAVEEETPLSRGGTYLGRTLRPPDALVVGEPSGWQSVVLGYRGKLDLRYEVRCPPGHPTGPGPRAGELAARAWSSLTELLGPVAGHTRFDVPGATLTAITGDLQSAEAEFSVRLPIGFDVDGLVAALRGAVRPGTVEVINAVSACRVSRRDPVARALASGVRARGGSPGAKVKTGTSDMNTLAQVWPVPMATYGPGDSRLDHGDDEHITVADYLKGIDVLVHALRELTGRSRDALLRAGAPLRVPELAERAPL